MNLAATYNRHRLAANITATFVLCLFAFLVIAPAQAQAYWKSSPSDGETGVSASGTFWVQYNHNIAGDPVVSGNKKAVKLLDENGNSVSCRVYDQFDGSQGDDYEGDSNARHFLYISVSGLEKGSEYTIYIPDGAIRTAGGSYAEGYSATFTTAGKKEEPKPDPPKTPDPPSTPEGGSGNSGIAATGGKDDHGSGSGAGNADSGAGDGGITTQQSDTTSQTVEEGASGADRAAGTGDGSVYVIQGTGAGTGLSDGNSLMGTSPAFNLSWLLALLMVALALAAFAFGAVRRGLWWNKHTRQGRE